MIGSGKKIISFALAAVMLAGGAVPASALCVIDVPAAAVSPQQLGALARPKIMSTKRGSSAVKLTWKKVNKATGYKVYLKTKSGWKCKGVVKGGDNVSFKVKGLDAKTKYTFKIKAYRKSKGKTYYSRFSAPVTGETTYGVGVSNWVNKYMSVNFNKHDWTAEGDKSVLALVSGELAPDCMLSFFAEKIAVDEEVTEDDLIDQYIEHFKRYGYEFTRAQDVTVSGKKFAKATGMIEVEDTQGGHDVLNYYVRIAGGKIYTISEQYSYENKDSCTEKLAKVWKKVYIK